MSNDAISFEDEAYIAAIAAEPKMVMDEVGADIEEHGHVAVTADNATQDPFTTKGCLANALDEALEGEPNDDAIDADGAKEDGGLVGYYGKDSKLLNPTNDFRDETKGEVEGTTDTPQNILHPEDTDEENTNREPTIQQDKAVMVKDSLAEALDSITMDADPKPDYSDYSEENASAIKYKAPDVPELLGGDPDKPDENGLVYVTATFTIDPNTYVSNNYKPKQSGGSADIKDAAKAGKTGKVGKASQAPMADGGESAEDAEAMEADEPTAKQEEQAAEVADKELKKQEQQKKTNGEDIVEENLAEEVVIKDNTNTKGKSSADKEAEDEAPEKVVLDYATYIDGSSFMCFDEVEGIDYTKIAMDAGVKKPVTRANCQTTFAQCRAQNPLFCRFHGPKLLEADIKTQLKAAVGSGCVVSVTKDKGAKDNKFKFRLTVGCPPSKKKMVEKIIHMFLTQNPGISSPNEEWNLAGKHKQTQEFEMDVLQADKPPKKSTSDKSWEGQALADTKKAKKLGKKQAVVGDTPAALEKQAAKGEKWKTVDEATENEWAQRVDWIVHKTMIGGNKEFMDKYEEIANQFDAAHDAGDVEGLKKALADFNAEVEKYDWKTGQKKVSEAQGEGEVQPQPQEAEQPTEQLQEQVQETEEPVEKPEEQSVSTPSEEPKAEETPTKETEAQQTAEPPQEQEPQPEPPQQTEEPVKKAATEANTEQVTEQTKAEEPQPIREKNSIRSQNYKKAKAAKAAAIQSVKDFFKGTSLEGGEFIGEHLISLAGPHHLVLSSLPKDNGREYHIVSNNDNRDIVIPLGSSAEQIAKRWEEEIAKEGAKSQTTERSTSQEEVAETTSEVSPEEPITSESNAPSGSVEPIKQSQNQSPNVIPLQPDTITHKAASLGIDGIRTASMVQSAQNDAKAAESIANAVEERNKSFKGSGMGESLARGIGAMAADAARATVENAKTDARDGEESLKKQEEESRIKAEKAAKGRASDIVGKAVKDMTKVVFADKDTIATTVPEAAEALISNLGILAASNGMEDYKPQNEKAMNEELGNIKMLSDKMDSIGGMLKEAIGKKGADFQAEDVEMLSGKMSKIATRIAAGYTYLKGLANEEQRRIDNAAEIKKQKDELEKAQKQNGGGEEQETKGEAPNKEGAKTSTGSRADTDKKIAKLYKDWVEEPIPEWVNNLSDDEASEYVGLLDAAANNTADDSTAFNRLTAWENEHSKVKPKGKNEGDNKGGKVDSSASGSSGDGNVQTTNSAKGVQETKIDKGQLMQAIKRVGLDAFKPEDQLKRVLNDARHFMTGNPRMEQKVKDIELILADRAAKKAQAEQGKSTKDWSRYFDSGVVSEDEMPKSALVGDKCMGMVLEALVKALEG